MTDNSGSYMRFTSDHHFPSSRPHNKNLASLVVKKSELEGNVAERGIDLRPPNPNAKGYEYKRTIYDRESNNAVGGFLSGVGTPTLYGGAIKNPGWDPKHPRLSRNPNWYEGRGKDRAKRAGEVLATIAGAVL
tara:strand:+ start:10547 stop:10945 length:399 start_codon:yes stop_codon:yes gene_type:complete